MRRVALNSDMVIPLAVKINGGNAMLFTQILSPCVGAPAARLLGLPTFGIFTSSDMRIMPSFLTLVQNSLYG